ncbi:glycosyltransferase family 4 protein [Paenibacillus sp. S29]|uniref:glycosyltransferase family 4 protein n=1 Tax=Paenibacillus sp. S29 TaxID=3394611 RepID=UPI0039BEDE50
MNTIHEQDGKTVVLLLSWRDIRSPKSGGAEIFTHEMLKRSQQGRFQFIHFSPQFEGMSEHEVIDGITYIRKGNIYSVIYYAMRYYRRHRRKIDYVINQANTHQFFTRFWVEASKRIFFIHQLTREIWFENAKFPLNVIGFHMEPLMLKLARKDRTLTVSPSTRYDLLKLGFHPDRVHLLPEGIEFDHWPREQFLTKESNPTFMYAGRFVKYKGIDLVVEAFGQLKEKFPQAMLWIAGKTDKTYVAEQLLPIMKRYGLTYGEPDEQGQSQADITFYGFVSAEHKLELMSRAHALVFPSLREGWGLTITEAAAVGTPSIVSNSPGLVDATDFGKSGYLCFHGDIRGLSEQMERAAKGGEDYMAIRERAYQYALRFHFDHTAAAFEQLMEDWVEEAEQSGQSGHSLLHVQQ